MRETNFFLRIFFFSTVAWTNTEASAVRRKLFAEKTEFDVQGEWIRTQFVGRHEAATLLGHRVDWQHEVSECLRQKSRTKTFETKIKELRRKTASFFGRIEEFREKSPEKTWFLTAFLHFSPQNRHIGRAILRTGPRVTPWAMGHSTGHAKRPHNFHHNTLHGRSRSISR